MADFKINPDSVVRNNHFIKSHVTELTSIVSNFENKYSELDSKVKAKVYIDINSLKLMVSEQMTEKTEFLAEMVQSLLDATGYTEDQLLELDPNSFETRQLYEHYIKKAYSEKYLSDILKAKNGLTAYHSDILDCFMDFLHESNGAYYYSTEIYRYAKITNFLHEFKEETGHDFITDFDLSEIEIYGEFISYYEVKSNEHKEYQVDNLFTNLKKYFTESFFTYGLKLSDLIPNGSNLLKYEGSFKYNISGNEVDFVIEMTRTDGKYSVLKLLYLFISAELIDTLYNLPEDYTNKILEGDPPMKIKLSNYKYDDDPNDDALGRYYSYEKAIRLYLDYILDSAYAEYYDKTIITSTFIHETGHALDDVLSNGYNKSKDYFTSESIPIWQSFFEKYADLLWEVQVNPYNGYSGDDLRALEQERGLKEFFAEAIKAYFTNPMGLAVACPDLFNYLQKIMNNLKDTPDSEPIVDPEPEPGPSPSPEPTPGPSE